MQDVTSCPVKLSAILYYLASAAAYVLVTGPHIYQRGRRRRKYATSDCRVPLRNETQVTN